MGKPDNPGVYAGAVVMALMAYPPEIVTQATDPRRGIQSTSKFLPSIAELTEACEKRMASLRARWREVSNMKKFREVCYQPDEQERKRMKVKFESLSAEVAKAADPVPDKIRKTVEQSLEALQEARQTKPL